MIQQVGQKSYSLKQQGNQLYHKKQYKKSIQKYTASISLNKDLVESYSNRALSYMQLDQYQLALDDCEMALKISPRHIKAIARKGKALTRLFRCKEAIELMEIERSIEPNGHYDQVIKQATKIKNTIEEYQQQRKNRQYQKAYKTLNQIASVVKDRIEIKICKLQSLCRFNPNEANQTLKSLQTSINQSTFIYWYFRFLIQLQIGSKFKAKRYLQQSIRLNPLTESKICSWLLFFKVSKQQLTSLLENIINSQKILSEIDNLKVQPTKVRQTIRKIQLLPMDAIKSQQKVAILFLRSQCYQSTKERPKQLNDLNIILRLNPTHEDALQARMRFYQYEQKYEMALKDAQNLSKLNCKYCFEVKKLKKLMKKQRNHKIDYYQVLQLQKTSSLEQIKRSYKQLVMIFHPDKNVTLNSEQQQYAQSKFKDIRKAYECLSSPEKRSVYDLNNHHSEDEDENFDTREKAAFNFMNMFRGFPGADKFFN